MNECGTPKEVVLRHFRLVAFAVLALALTAPWTAKADPVAEETFLRSLSQTVQEQPAPTPGDPIPGAGDPAPQQRTCNISRACGDGNTVACTGNYSCANSQRGVTCDGVETACPNYCSMGWTCQDCPSYAFFCWSLKGDCGVTNTGCDGRPQRCLCPLSPQS